MGALRRVAMAGAAAVLALLAACSGATERPPAAPPRATDRIVLPQDPSEIAVDLKVDLADLERALEAEIPRRLWAIDRPGSECVASKKVDLALFKVKSPKIKCRIVGEVTRGRLRLGGSGRTIRVTMPIRGTLAARDVAGIFKGETGTGAADVTLSLRFDVDRNWRIKGDTRIDYSWSKEPGIDFLGRRITFTTDADRELAPVKRNIERTLSRELARLPLKATAQQGWTEAHQILSINRENPAVWGRLTPRQFRFGGYEVAGGTLTLKLGLDAALETFVGIAPDPIAPGPLPPLAPRDKTIPSSVLHVPVVADYAVLEPVIAKALAKRAQRPFRIEDYGSVRASFENITVYGTTGGRIAVGGRFAATSDLPLIKAASGTIWLTARPANAPGSRAVRFTEVKIAGETDIIGQDFIFALANSPDFQGAITDALAQNFENDFTKLRAKIDRALTKPGGRLTETRIALENVRTGVISAHGEGLYLPVDLTVRITSRLRSLN